MLCVACLLFIVTFVYNTVYWRRIYRSGCGHCLKRGASPTFCPIFTWIIHWSCISSCVGSWIKFFTFNSTRRYGACYWICCLCYSLTDIQLNRKYYNDAKRGINEFSSQEDKEQYGLHCSRNHIWVKYFPTNAVVYKCSVIGVAPRNFLLELHASGYIIHRWLERRRAGDFDSMNYEGSALLWHTHPLSLTLSLSCLNALLPHALPLNHSITQLRISLPQIHRIHRIGWI